MVSPVRLPTPNPPQDIKLKIVASNNASSKSFLVKTSNLQKIFTMLYTNVIDMKCDCDAPSMPQFNGVHNFSKMYTMITRIIIIVSRIQHFHSIPK